MTDGTTSMNSTITIVDTDDEVIELEESQNDIVIVHDNGESKDDFETRESDLSTCDVIGDYKFIEKTPNVNENFEPYQHVKSTNNSKPMFKVIFQDENIARQYEKEIRQFLQDLVLKTSQQITDSSFSNIILEIWNKTKNCDQQLLEANTEGEDSKDTSSLFTIDTQPTLKSNVDIPKYRKKYKGVIDEDKEEELEPEKKDSCVRQISCFNCSGNHNLRNCKMPWNIANINKNRKELSMRNNNRGIRYHLDDDQRFGHMIPGQISKDLRIALGLKDYELPMHIYKMRVLGYPPGWLEEARLQHSGLSLFNSDGIAELDPNDEPGEIVAEEDRDRYDIKKIFDYPGFNVPPPPGTHDKLNVLWTPEKQSFHSKKNMLFHLSGKKAAEGYKRKKLKSNMSLMNDSPTVSSDMEIEDLSGTEGLVESVPINGHFIPPLPKDVPIKPPEPPSSLSTSEQCLFDCQSQDSADESASSLSRTNSPSLSDLESMKKRLLVELEDSSSQSNLDAPMKCSSLNSSMKSEVLLSSNEHTPQFNRFQSAHSIFNTSQGSIKSVDFGTPILQSTSTYNKLPSSEKFSKNICDVINFENLPDSTGKYEQITGVLQKVRSTLAKLHEDS
ncbi:zinc finger CCHC domain-containing protein 8 homolog [Vespa mandarinia]|uniref:zinc finger CCHC domain-containing protein 8 homolog n=1 Tax=Vespa mandarinia TaxID=7446 RepID=UPI00161A425C|nr:zinc finger CCHC domain-containing protein 8 homolog [Vespa mandarinia]XP_035740868.1 zinc finger CCHC domain-containing protein 8 homolog [Vespa mandarinia]